MEDIGLRAEEICDIFKIVASVLKLGNLQFVPTTNMDGTEGCGIANEYGNKICFLVIFLNHFWTKDLDNNDETIWVQCNDDEN